VKRTQSTKKMRIKLAKQNKISKIRLGVNIDHAATLRQVRGGTTDYPNLSSIISLAKEGGADQITIHLREDRRHIQDRDVVMITKERQLEINLEMAATSEMQKIALKHKPDWVCLVPEKRFELTTEGGLDVASRIDFFKSYVSALQKKGISVSLFIDPNEQQVSAAAEIGAKAVEFHTGHWVLATGAKKKKIWTELVLASNQAHEACIVVNAGHGLDYAHTKEITKLPHLNEVNIGHSIICYALEDGLLKTTKKFVEILNGK